MKQNSHIIYVPATVAVVVLTIIFICGVNQVEGGCSRFGHSCFGAHGKRGNIPSAIDFGSDGNLVASQQGPAERGGEGYPITYPNGVRLSPYFVDWLVASSRQHDQDLKSSHDRFKEESSAPVE